MQISVIGTGYVGLVTGVVFADQGNKVVCVDNDPHKVAKLKAGIPPIFEPGVTDLLKKGLENGSLTISDSIAEATSSSEIVFIAVGTPPGPDGAPDMTAVSAVASEIGRAINKYTLVVNKSTVPLGSGDLVESLLLKAGAKREHFEVLSNPEFLREGTAVRDTLEPDRIVIGANDTEAAQKLASLYETLDRPILITDRNSSELIKYASNSFLAMKISFINAISRICEISEANIGAVARGVGADSRIGNSFLHAGLGWGGSCLPKDVQGLISISEKIGYDFALLREVQKINVVQTDSFLDRAEERLGGFSGQTICLLGLAFKPNTDDVRDAKSRAIVERILRSGGTVRAYDPVAMVNFQRELGSNERFYCAANVFDAAEGSDALIVATEWNDFKQIDLRQLGLSMRSKILFDGRRLYNSKVAREAGFEYHVIGERTKEPAVQG